MATGGDSGSSSGVTADQLKELMASMRQGIRDEISSMKHELATEREAADEKLVKRLKLEKAPVFKKKGNERQYRHNEEVRLKVSDAASALSETPPAVEKAKTLLEEGEKLIVDRQKLIRIADRSENGWATVDEYVEDELADNSDDEKRLNRADARASKKLKAQKNGKGTRKPNPYAYRKNFNNSHNWSFGPAAGQSMPPSMYPMVPTQPGAMYPAGTGVGMAALGPCFECGMPGHYRKYCPNLKGLSGKGTGAMNK